VLKEDEVRLRQREALVSLPKSYLQYRLERCLGDIFEGHFGDNLAHDSANAGQDDCFFSFLFIIVCLLLAESGPNVRV
jgi:hypothetical protein